MSGIARKIKDAVSGDKTHHQSSAAEGTYGPHGSRVANAMDPRVDSDRDNSRPVGTGTAEGVYGPHGSRFENAMDPRVDSDRDNSRTIGTGRPAGHGELGSTAFGTGTAEGTYGPHHSRAANAMDPRVDSDRDNSRTKATGTCTAGAGSSMAGMTGTRRDPAGAHGPHNSRVTNILDPRVDSDRDGHAALGSGSGSAKKTAGPHKSDLLNKLDPRVDSDLDNSRTTGGSKTYQ